MDALDSGLLLRSFLIGIVIAAPLGPVNILCINRTLRFGFWAGVFSGVGAMIGDGIYAAIAAYGLTAISDTLRNHTQLIKLIGGIVLVAMGVRIMSTRAEVAGEGAGLIARRPIATVMTTLAVTLTNPAAMLGVLALFGATGDLLYTGSFFGATVVVLMVMAGSMFWWMFLATVISALRTRIAHHSLKILNIISGTALIIFGVVLLLDEFIGFNGG